MAVRPIDGNDFMRQLTLDTSKGHYGEFMDGSEVAYTSREIAKFVEDMPTLTPPNEPLTWNELGNMMEKPVYIVELEDGESCWVLVHTVDDIKALFVSAFDQYDYGNRELYGQTWLAYRRLPEVSP